MHYAQMRKYDIANGIGIRSSLFVSGCTHQCPGCFNTDYRAFDYGLPWTKESEDTFLDYIKDDNVHGVTILGGEPMQQIDDDDLLNLLKRIKKETNENIWIYSGYTYEEILKEPKRREILELCDVLVDGRFIESLKDMSLKFRGSSNQNIIDVQSSLRLGKKVLLTI